MSGGQRPGLGIEVELFNEEWKVYVVSRRELNYRVIFRNAEAVE